MADFVDWRVRKGTAARRFSDGLVVQGMLPGLLDLSVCRVPGGQASPEALGFLGPLAAACTSEGVRRDTGIVSWLHWPNLVTINDRVVAKTSLSLAAPAESARKDARGAKTQITMEVSVNCFARSSSAFPSIAMPSTSIREVLGVEIDPDLLRDKILHALNWYYAEWERGMHRKLAERIQPTIAWLGRSVEVRTLGGLILRGKAKGLDDLGSLLLEKEGGGGKAKTFTVRPESVELVRAAK